MTPEQLQAFAMLTGNTAQPAKSKSVYYLALDADGKNLGNWFIDAGIAEVLNAKFVKAKIKITLQLPDPDFKLVGPADGSGATASGSARGN